MVKLSTMEYQCSRQVIHCNFLGGLSLLKTTRYPKRNLCGGLLWGFGMENQHELAEIAIIYMIYYIVQCLQAIRVLSFASSKNLAVICILQEKYNVFYERILLSSPADCAVALRQNGSGERGRPHVVRRVSYIPLAWPNNRITSTIMNNNDW